MENNINPEHYVLSKENKEITGFWTVAEWGAYELGREHEQKIIMKYIEEWDGSTNSVFGSLMQKNFNKYA